MKLPDAPHSPTTAAATEFLSGAEILCRALKAEGVEFVFGYPGGAVLAISAAIVAYSWNSADDIYDDLGEIDAKILTGELPIDAFLDKDFASWVKESS